MKPSNRTLTREQVPLNTPLTLAKTAEFFRPSKSDQYSALALKAGTSIEFAQLSEENNPIVICLKDVGEVRLPGTHFPQDGIVIEE
ncbi:MAG: hypothetical protein WC599_06285 [Bacteroidales bacterium]